MQSTDDRERDNNNLRTSKNRYFIKMGAVPFFILCLVELVTSRNVPKPFDISPSTLELIWGPATDKSEVVTTSDLVANESIITPYKKDNNNTTSESGPNTVELKIKVDCDKKAPDKSEDDKHVKQSPGKCEPEVHTRNKNLSSTDDRVALDADECPSDQVKFNGMCVTRDK